jgi:methylated-DNA-protein-cysteine methyltransferase-like protein
VEASAAGAQREEAAEWEAAAAKTPKGEGAEWEIAARGAGQENAAAGEPAEGEAAGREAGKEEAEAEIAALIDKKRGELKSEMAGIMRYPAEVRKICFECIKWLKNQEIFAEIADMDLLTKEQSDRITSGALRDDVYAIVNSIPEGCVLSYGAVAAFAGAPNHARLVGRLMSRSPDCVNAHRVVSSRGATAPHWDGQRALLELEGVKFLPDGRVDMKEHLWRGRARKDVQLAHC